jgi:hypothetical protein
MGEATSPSEEPRAVLRRSLLDQLAYLIDELEAQKPILSRMPEDLLEAQPLPGAWSIKERYGLLAAADESFHLPGLERMVEEAEPVLDVPELQALVDAEPWNTYPIQNLLDRIQAARRAFLKVIAALPDAAWERSAVVKGERRHVFAFAHRAVQHDADSLRAIGHLLFDRRASGAS